MDQTSIADANAERESEARQLADLDNVLTRLERMQRILLPQMQRGQDLQDAEGRRCILVLEGLKFHKFAKFFEVSRSGVRLVEPFDTYNTAILAPLDSVIRVLKQVLDGKRNAFSSEWARGKARIIGSRSMHDGYVFGQVFDQLAEVIGRYKGRAGST